MYKRQDLCAVSGNTDLKNFVEQCHTDDLAGVCLLYTSAWTTGSATKTGAIAIDFGSDVSIENVKTGFWSKLKLSLIHIYTIST